MGNYVQVRIQSGGNIGGQISHDCRRRKPAYVKGESEVVMMLYKGDSDIYMDYGVHNIVGDDSLHIKSIQDSINIEKQSRIKQQNERYKEVHKRAMPKTSNHFFKGIITFSHEDTAGEKSNEKERKYLDRCAEMYLRIINDKYGVYPLYLARHEDETTVHYHFVAENFDYEKARTVQRALSREQFSKMQDFVAVAFEPERYERGKPKFKTGANHVKFQDWERKQIAIANKEVTQTAQIIKNSKSDMVELKSMANNVTNDLLEILKLIVEKEKKLDKFKEVLQKYKKLRHVHIETHSNGMNDESVGKLRKIEEGTGKTRQVLKTIRNELSTLKTKRDNLINGVESKTKAINTTIETTDNTLNNVHRNLKKQR